MFNRAAMKFLESLLNSSGPSGFEMETAAVFRHYIAEFTDESYTDVTGNTIGVLNPGAPMKVMLAGHYDEIGFQVVYISPEGMIFIRENGGIDKLTVPGTEVVILTEQGKIPGVIGKKPIHLLAPKERDQAVELKNLWVDIGAENQKEAEKLVSIGDPVAFKSNFTRLGKHRIVSKGMDDKIGAFIVAETLKKLRAKKPRVAVYGVGTVQEELGLRGAATSAFGINPRVGFAVDVGFVTDIPDIEKKQIGATALGKGPIIAINANNNPVLVKTMKRIAAARKIKIQTIAGYKASGGTDTAQIQLTRSGVATALISVPNRYMHTQVEMCDLRDVEAIVDLLTETIASFSGRETFIPGID